MARVFHTKNGRRSESFFGERVHIWYVDGRAESRWQCLCQAVIDVALLDATSRMGKSVAFSSYRWFAHTSPVKTVLALSWNCLRGFPGICRPIQICLDWSDQAQYRSSRYEVWTHLNIQALLFFMHSVDYFSSAICTTSSS